MRYKVRSAWSPGFSRSDAVRSASHHIWRGLQRATPRRLKPGLHTAQVMASAPPSMHFDNRFAENFHFRLNAEAGRGGCSHAAVGAARCAVGSANGDVAVEVGGAEEKFLRRAMSEVRDGGGSDVAAPGI